MAYGIGSAAGGKTLLLRRISLAKLLLTAGFCSANCSDAKLLLNVEYAKLTYTNADIDALEQSLISVCF